MANRTIKKNKKAADPMSATDLSLEEKIRRLAYKLYEERGCQDGDPLRDWLKAEQLVSKPHIVPPAPNPEQSASKSRARKTAKTAAV